MDEKFKLIIDSFGTNRFIFNEPIKNHTFLKIGGPAKIFFIAFTTSEIIKLVTMCKDLNLPFSIFGMGSKMMISDAGFDGLVIQNRTRNIHTISVKGKVSKTGIGVEEAFVEVESGVSILKFCESLDSQGFAVVEFLGIPGTLGGSLFVSSVLQSKTKSIKVLDQNCEVEEIEPSQLRTKSHIILSAVIKVKSKN